MKRNLDINRLWLAQFQRIHVHLGPSSIGHRTLKKKTVNQNIVKQSVLEMTA